MATRSKKIAKRSQTHGNTKYPRMGSSGRNHIRITHQRHTPGRMNGTENQFASLLSSQIGKTISHWEFESHTLRLAEKTTYTPDFYVITNEGQVIFYEVKGYWTPAARIKIKIAASLYPQYRFIAAKIKRGEWEYEEFPQ